MAGAPISIHTDRSASKKRINCIKGQFDAVSRMIDEGACCPDIIPQIRAATSAFRGLETEVLRGHLRVCVKKAMESQNSFEVNDKIEEILRLVSK
jgi:DNA-binding FrmR family transcriptional regulator